jgi:hypothetical protein
MKIAHAASILLFACVLGGCKQPASETAPASEAPAAPQAAAARLDKAQVLASGRKGFWSADGNEVCTGTRSRVTLAWNVQDATHARVVVWMDRNGKGKERAVKSGAAVGVFTTGPWVAPGAVFVLREVETRRELGKLAIGGKQCRCGMPPLSRQMHTGKALYRQQRVCQ